MSNYTEEGTGHITSDSLASESLNQNPTSGFASNKSTVNPSSQPSHGTTANTTDTSGATTLDSAPDARSRLNETEAQGTNYQTPAEISGMDKTADSTSGSGSGSGGAAASNTGDAPSVYAAGSRATGDQLKPKGANITEVENFENEGPNASFNNEIGGKNDPGRQAEQAFANSAQKAVGDAGHPRAYDQGGKDDKGGFENLGTDQQA